MSSDSRTSDAEMPDDGDLEEPSTEKEPEEEPTAPDAGESEPEPSHRAVGLGVDYQEPAPRTPSPGEADDGQPAGS